MSRRDFDFFKYAKLDPEDDEVFFGPITLRELKRSVEVEEEIVRRRLEEKKNAAKQAEAENKENEVLDRTFEIVDTEDEPQHINAPQRTLNDITQFHYNLDETKLVDLSVQFSKAPMKLPKSAAAVKQTKCLLDETLNLNESKIGGRLRTPLIDKQAKCLLDETVHLRESRIEARLRTPLIEKMARSKRVNSASKKSEEETIVRTPRLIKLSDTFITDVLGDNVLNGTIPDDADNETEIAARVGTPDIFKQKRNEIWKDSTDLKQKTKIPMKKVTMKDTLPVQFFAKSPGVMVGMQSLSIKKRTPVKSHGHLFSKSPGPLSLPKKNTPVATNKDHKPLFFKSPVADYIHRGIGVQSMSKVRHSACVNEIQEVRSKSENKGVPPCKIPVAMSGCVKRKLNLEARRTFFSSPKN